MQNQPSICLLYAHYKFRSYSLLLDSQLLPKSTVWVCCSNVGLVKGSLCSPDRTTPLAATAVDPFLDSECHWKEVCTCISFRKCILVTIVMHSDLRRRLVVPRCVVSGVHVPGQLAGVGIFEGDNTKTKVRTWRCLLYWDSQRPSYAPTVWWVLLASNLL